MCTIEDEQCNCMLKWNGTCSSNETTLGWSFSRVKWAMSLPMLSGKLGRMLEQKSLRTCREITRLTFSWATKNKWKLAIHSQRISVSYLEMWIFGIFSSNATMPEYQKSVSEVLISYSTPTCLNEYLQILSQFTFIKIWETLQNFQKPAKGRNIQQILKKEQAIKHCKILLWSLFFLWGITGRNRGKRLPQSSHYEYIIIYYTVDTNKNINKQWVRSQYEF